LRGVELSVHRPSRFVDADGCELAPGFTTWEPWRWGRIGAAARARCSLGRGVKMRDPDSGDCLPRYFELAFEV